MRNERYGDNGNVFNMRLADLALNVPRKALVGTILIVALFAFEIFNFDTTQFALRSLLGDVRFLGLQWASILAIAFCSIDFAGLIRLFTPEKSLGESKEVWYLMGAWLLGATMNAMMTWWAVSLTLLNNNYGNEVLSRDQLLQFVPIFVAVLVWLTRILFIGAFTVAGEHLFDFSGNGRQVQNGRARGTGNKPQPTTQPSQPVMAAPIRSAPTRAPQPVRSHTRPPQPVASTQSDVLPNFLDSYQPTPAPSVQSGPQPAAQPGPKRPQVSRIRQRPPRPNGVQRPVKGVQARSRNRDN